MFLLNLTPDRRGLIPEKDATRLRELGDILKKTFATNLVKGATAEASEAEKGYRAESMLDDNEDTFWKPDDGTEAASVIIHLPTETAFNRFVLQEAIKSQGQRIEQFAVDAWKDNQWEEVAQGTVVGYKNIRRFPMVKSNKVRLRILSSRVSPTLSMVGLYQAPEMLSNPVISRNQAGVVTITCQTPDPEIYYTLNSSEPDSHATRYTEPIALPDGGTIKARAFTEAGAGKSEIIRVDFDVSPAQWSVISSSNSNTFPARYAIDADNNTYWQSQHGEANPFVSIDLGEALVLRGFTYLPQQNGKTDTVCKKYRVEVSPDGEQWRLAKQGSFDNIQNDPSLRKEMFPEMHKVRYVRFTGLENVAGGSAVSIAELGVITR